MSIQAFPNFWDLSGKTGVNRPYEWMEKYETL